MVLDVLKRECHISDCFGILILFYFLIWLSVRPDFVPADWSINSFDYLVEFKDLITLRVHVLNLSSDNWIVNFLPFFEIFLIMSGSCKECHIIDNVKSFKLIEDTKAAFYNLGAEGEANHWYSLCAKGVTERKRDPD